MSRVFESSELIINSDGSVFHLHLKPDDIAEKIILVGDPGRVDLVASFFDSVEVKKHNREFYTITGTIKNERITAISTGIGTDNIDIVINELDALANIDLDTRKERATKRVLQFIRIGTSGGIQKDLIPGAFLASKAVFGFDGLLNFYNWPKEKQLLDLQKAFMDFTKWPDSLAHPYSVAASPDLLEKIAYDLQTGLTISANGFYGPQGRELRAPLSFPELFESLPLFTSNYGRITNFEMECSALYGLSSLLGHQALTVCAIIANRVNKKYIGDYSESMKRLVELVLKRFLS